MKYVRNKISAKKLTLTKADKETLVILTPEAYNY
jgi:hypothetical protein